MHHRTGGLDANETQGDASHVRRYVRRTDLTLNQVDGIIQDMKADLKLVVAEGEGQRIEFKRVEYKDRLLAEWNQAVEHEQIDEGIELLQKLDEYLSPAEAAQMRESAKGLFQAKLESLGAIFGVAVSEQKWNRALAIGQELINEFPNSRMAEEVKGKLDILQQRAQEQAQV